MTTERRLAAALASALTLSACGGGGAGTAPGAPLAPTPQGSATVPMTIAIPRRMASDSARAPQFLSPNSAAIAIYDGTTLVYVANLSLDSTPPFATVFASSGSTTVAFGTCSFTSSTATCTLTVTTTIGAHKFDVITYPASQGSQGTGAAREVRDTGTPPTFHGVIASEGELAVTLSPGANAAQTLTLLGVADQVLYAGLSEAAYNTDTTYGYRIEDSSNAQIVLPGNAYDNGPVTITAAPSGIVTIAPNTIATPPATLGDQNFTVTCVNAAGGAVTITVGVTAHPNTTYASGLTYSASNYPGATIATIPFTCDPATATIPIGVQEKRK